MTYGLNLSAPARTQFRAGEKIGCPNSLPTRTRVVQRSSKLLCNVSTKKSDQCVEKAKDNARKVAAVAGSVLLPTGAAVAADTELSKPLEIAVDAVDIAIDTAAALVKQGQSLTADAVGVAEKATPYVDRAGKAFAPILGKASDLAQRTVVPKAADALKAGSEVAGSSLTGLESSLNAQGVDIAPVKQVAGTVAGTVATEAPKVGSAVADWVLLQDPQTLAKLGLGGLAAYIVLPVILKVLGSTARGYAGDLRPPQALELMSKDKGSTVVDIRTEDEQMAKGGIAVAKSMAKQVVDLSRTTLPDRGNFRNPSAVEAKLTALKLAALKSVSKGSKIVLLCSNGKMSKIIAKELANMGYKSTYVIEGGFEQWKADKLQTQALYTTSGEVSSSFAPRLALPGTVRGSKSIVDVKSKTIFSRGTRALPPPK